MAGKETRPMDLVFVRHGESEANVAYRNARERGEGYSDEFRNKPNSEMELSPLGVQQAKAAGRWIEENVNGGVFVQYFVSSFKRAMHTAGYLQLPEGEIRGIWKVRDYLREQDYGYFDGFTTEELKEKYPEIMRRKEIDGVYWTRLGGESMAELVFRTKIGIIETLYREVPETNAIVVAHEKLLWAVRIILEGLTYDTNKGLDNPNNPRGKINNCQVLHYTRTNPNNSGEITENFTWMRSVCPWNLELSDNEWKTITRPKFTNQDLLNR